MNDSPPPPPPPPQILPEEAASFNHLGCTLTPRNLFLEQNLLISGTSLQISASSFMHALVSINQAQ